LRKILSQEKTSMKNIFKTLIHQRQAKSRRQTVNKVVDGKSRERLAKKENPGLSPH